MAWLTRTHLEDRFGVDFVAQLETDGADVAPSLSDAEAEVDSYLARVAVLPLAVVPDNLIRLAATIARYNLRRRDVAEDHPAYIAYRAALKELAAMAAGEISIGLPVGDVATGSSFAVRSRPAAFSETTLGKMVI